MDLNGKIALITGAGGKRGIGRATALQFACCGADVALTDVHREPEDLPSDEVESGWRVHHGSGVQRQRGAVVSLKRRRPCANHLTIPNLLLIRRAQPFRPASDLGTGRRCTALLPSPSPYGKVYHSIIHSDWQVLTKRSTRLLFIPYYSCLLGIHWMVPAIRDLDALRKHSVKNDDE